MFIIADAAPTGGISRPRVCEAVVTEDSNRQATRVTTPVWMTPFAITSIAATVMTPPLLRPAKSCEGSAIPRIAATEMAAASEHRRHLAGGHGHE